jgi:soluble lytic murein transglycosylase-like protein
MRLKLGLILFLVILNAGTFALHSFGQALYSYRDENGIQVFTNIPPVNAVYDLKVTGLPHPAPTTDNSIEKSQKIEAIIEKYAGEHQLDPSLIRSIIAAESGFNPKAVSPKGARGLMQLMPATAERLGVTNSFDPEQNIRGGVQHFRALMDTFGDNLDLSLAAYNAGENLVQRLGRVPRIKETRDYVQTVTSLYGKKDLTLQNEEKLKYPPAFRFVDDSGVLHLTNIPPLR